MIHQIMVYLRTQEINKKKDAKLANIAEIQALTLKSNRLNSHRWAQNTQGSGVEFCRLAMKKIASSKKFDNMLR